MVKSKTSSKVYASIHEKFLSHFVVHEASVGAGELLSYPGLKRKINVAPNK